MPNPDLARLVWPRRTTRLVLRPLTLDDVEAIHAYRSLPEVVVHLSHDVLSRAEVEARVADRIARGRPGAAAPLLGLALEDGWSGRVVGDVMLRLEASRSISRTPTDRHVTRQGGHLARRQPLGAAARGVARPRHEAVRRSAPDFSGGAI